MPPIKNTALEWNYYASLKVYCIRNAQLSYWQHRKLRATTQKSVWYSIPRLGLHLLRLYCRQGTRKRLADFTRKRVKNLTRHSSPPLPLPQPRRSLRASTKDPRKGSPGSDEPGNVIVKPSDAASARSINQNEAPIACNGPGADIKNHDSL